MKSFRKILLSVISLLGIGSMLLAAYFGEAAIHPWQFWGLVGGITTIAVLGLFSIILD